MYVTYFDFTRAALEPTHSNCCGLLPKKKKMVTIFYINYTKEII